MQNKQKGSVRLFSDEVSILIRGGNNSDSENNRIEKLLSLLPSKLSLLFHKFAQKNNLNLQENDCIFDARIIELEKEQVIDYFLARQAYAIDKYIMQLKAENHIDYKLNTSKEVIPQLKTKGVLYESLPAKYRYGLTYSIHLKSNSFEFDTNKTLLKQMCFGR